MVFEKRDAKSDAQTVVNQRTNASGINAELQRVRTQQRLHALCVQHTEQSWVANSSQRQAEHSAPHLTKLIHQGTPIQQLDGSFKAEAGRSSLWGLQPAVLQLECSFCPCKPLHKFLRHVQG